ncbi:hypothetical protein PIB30_027274 [Stylosanthes scabra]|uniref:Lipoxygenase n=1 Tax=Stylosanthes scabra TaxID=79078 RepID=A0ABU6X853_9FABA|nr:hypothetical protein [Stylosanthes scabra]
MLGLLDTYPLYLHNNGSLLCQPRPHLLSIGNLPSTKERGLMMLSLLGSNGGGGTKKKVRAMRQTPTVAALTDGEKRVLTIMSPESTTTIAKLTAEVSVRNSSNNNKVFAKNMMNTALFNIFRPTSQSHTDKGLVLQLVSTQPHSNGREAKLSDDAVLVWPEDDVVLGGEGTINTYKVEFCVDSDFGVPGAVAVLNRYDSEFFLESINIQQLNVHFPCQSWVQPMNKIDPHKRIFFFDKAYLPSETPIGLKELRKRELRQLRGDGRGHRKSCDKIYDYDVYNDLGDPDKGHEYARPTLGGLHNPYPTRCRTGRPPARMDSTAESRPSGSESIYVPRDEELADIKRHALDQAKLIALARNIVPALLDKMGNEGVLNVDNFIKEPRHSESKYMGLGSILAQLPPWSLLNLGANIEELFKFDPPKIFSREKSHFLEDDEFGRQVLAGLNPLSIERLKVFPPVSKLDPCKWGSVESALKEEHIIDHIDGMSIQQALEENKLFILDYHDIFLPFLDRINALDDRKAYATTTIFFLTKMGTLKPIAIQLALPTMDPNTSSKKVLTPPVDTTTKWLWQLGKAHVCSNDAFVHTYLHHWLRIHATMEPFIIAAHRQLSVMHPIYKLLRPHMRYTLKTNATARETLINAGGILETNFGPGRYSMQITSAAYRDWWQFDQGGLPADLIRRGLAVPDESQPQGVRLVIEDYPYAADGLLIWSSIEKLVKTYVNYYYKDVYAISSDYELQSWYNEFINLGHPDHKNDSWWPKLSAPENLISILTTIIWIVTAQHAVLNFSQYHYGGYVPMRPALMRKLIPKEDDLDYVDFVMDPQRYFESSLPSLSQATKFMAVTSLGSAHSPEEEYIGDRNDLCSWSEEPEIIDAFNQFSTEIKNIETEIEKRNADPKLRNRCGVGVIPYELLMPWSGQGVTGRGVPNSVTA